MVVTLVPERKKELYPYISPSLFFFSFQEEHLSVNLIRGLFMLLFLYHDLLHLCMTLRTHMTIVNCVSWHIIVLFLVPLLHTFPLSSIFHFHSFFHHLAEPCRHHLQPALQGPHFTFYNFLGDAKMHVL